MALDSKTINDVILQLQATSAKLAEIAAKVDISAESLAIHDADPDAHAQIRALIENLDAITLVQLTEAIAAHATSSTAHGDLRTLVSNLTTTVNSISVAVGDGVAAHNTDINAHASLRASVSSLSTTVNALNEYFSYIQQLPALYGDDPSSGSPLTEINTRITEVSSKTTDHSSHLLLHDAQISDLYGITGNLKAELTAVEGDVAALKSSAGIHEVSIQEIRLNMGFGNQGVDLAGISNTFPQRVKRGSSVSFKIIGVTIPTGDTLAISLVASNSGITFSKSSNILLGEVITANIPSDIGQGSVFSIIATLTLTVAGTSSRYAISSGINSVPTMANFKHNVPAKVEPSKAYSVAFWGATDPDGEALTYSLVPLTGNLTFSKTAGISANETVTMNVPASLVRGSTGTFKVVVTDALGETAEQIISVLSTTLPNLDGLSHNIPSKLIPGEVYGVKLSGAVSTDGSVLTYGIEEVDGSGLTFSKTSGIVEGGTVLMTAAANVVRGSSHTIRITVTSSLGSSVTRDVPVTINRVPDISALVFSLPSSVSPNNINETGFNGTYVGCKLSGVTDADAGQNLTCNISCSDPTNVTFSKSKNLAINEAFDINIGAGVTRGANLTFTVTITDGLEIQTKTFIRKVNILPSAPTCTGLLTEVLSKSQLALSFGATDSESEQVYFLIRQITATGATASKTSGITPGEQITLDLPAVSTYTPCSIVVAAYNRGVDVNGAFLLNDWASAISQATFTFTIKPADIVGPPVVTNPTEGAVLSSDIVNFQLSEIAITTPGS